MSAGRRTRGGGAGPDRIVRVLAALLTERRRTGGWVRVKDLAEETRVNKSSIYRYLDALDANGFPVERDQDNGRRGPACRGVRSAHYITRRPDPASEEGTYS